MAIELSDIEKELEAATQDIKKASGAAQKKIFAAVKTHVQQLDTIGGRYDRKQNPVKKLAQIEKSINDILNTGYAPSVFDYLNQVYNTTGKVSLIHKRRNGISVDKKLFESAKVDLEQKLSQSMFPDGDTFRESYIQPIKNLVYLKARSGATIADMTKFLSEWNDGNLSTANNVIQQAVPSLDSYATQLARDTAFQHNGHVQQLIADEYDLNAYEYVGGIIDGSRPLCIYLVRLGRPVLKKELPALLKKYPQGVIKGTTAENFGIYRGGRGCRHQAMPVRVDE